MDFWKICEVIFIVAVLAVMGVLEKKQPKKARQVESGAFTGSLGIALIFALIEALSAFGIKIFDVPWAFTPLDIMSTMAAIYLIVLSGRKLFGFIDVTDMAAEK